MRATDRLRRAGIAFTRSEHAERLVVRHLHRTIDFWPRRGEWVDRAHRRRRLGVRALIQELTR